MPDTMVNTTFYFFPTGNQSCSSATSTALSALTSQVNLIPVQQNSQQQQQQQQYNQQMLQFSPQNAQTSKPAIRRRSSGQTPGPGGKRRPSSGNK